MTHKSYSRKMGTTSAQEAKHPGPERELLRLLANEVPEVRGLTAILVGKLAGKIALHPAATEAVRGLLDDSDPRVIASADRAIAAIDKATQAHAKLAPDEKLIVTTGNYEVLESYKTTVILYQGTVAFCNRFISLRSRTHDQMVQACRSGKQNIVEGCKASGISKKTELKLVGVARASLEELLEDFTDFLRHKNLPIWGKNDPQAKDIRKLAYAEDKSYETYRSYVEKGSHEVAANTLLCLTHQANYLLDKQLASLEAAFVSEGGFTERLYRVRSARRRRQDHQRG
jgi:restriction system protein